MTRFSMLTPEPARRVKTGELIRDARAEAGLTQRELADRVGTTQSAVARWESGRAEPGLHKLDQILRACGIELDLRFRRHADVDQPQLAWNLAQTNEQRLSGLRNVSRLLAGAHQVS